MSATLPVKPAAPLPLPKIDAIDIAKRASDITTQSRFARNLSSICQSAATRVTPSSRYPSARSIVQTAPMVSVERDLLGKLNAKLYTDIIICVQKLLSRLIFSPTYEVSVSVGVADACASAVRLLRGFWRGFGFLFCFNIR